MKKRPLEKGFLVCVLREHDTDPPEGSEVRVCSKCHRKVWVAPSSVALLRRNPKLEILCTRCMPPEILTLFAEARPTPEQMREMIQHWLKKRDEGD